MLLENYVRVRITEKTNESSQRISKDVKVYFKALSIRKLDDIGMIKMEVSSGNLVVANITPLAKKSIDDTKLAVDELCVFVDSIGGEIARLGDERIVVAPPSIKIWKAKENLE